MLQLPSPQRRQSSLSRLELLRLPTETALPTTHVLHSLPQPYPARQMQMITTPNLLPRHGALEATIKLLGLNPPLDKHQWASSCNHPRLQDFAPLLPRTRTSSR